MKRFAAVYELLEWIAPERERMDESGPKPETFGERAVRELVRLENIVQGLETLAHDAVQSDGKADLQITLEIAEREANLATTIMYEIGDELRARLEREQ